MLLLKFQFHTQTKNVGERPLLKAASRQYSVRKMAQVNTQEPHGGDILVELMDKSKAKVA